MAPTGKPNPFAAKAAPPMKGGAKNENKMELDSADDALDVKVLKQALSQNGVDPKLATKVVNTYKKLDD